MLIVPMSRVVLIITEGQCVGLGTGQLLGWRMEVMVMVKTSPLTGVNLAPHVVLGTAEFHKYLMN